MFIDTFSEEKCLAHTGLTRQQFVHIFTKYCGIDTPIPTQKALYYLLCFFKAYPIKRAVFNYHTVRMNAREGRSLSTLKKRARYLATHVNELQPLWNARHHLSNRLPLHFAYGVSGSIDTFPIRVSRPVNSVWQRSLYNGKFKTHTVKIQAIVNHAGCIIWFSGPHVGVTNDYELFSRVTPPLLNGEMLLADKGYCGESNSNFLITPIKNKRGHELTSAAVEYNICHARYMRMQAQQIHAACSLLSCVSSRSCLCAVRACFVCFVVCCCVM